MSDAQLHPSAAGPRRAVRRALALTAIIALTYGFAVLVARPHVPDPATNPYAGQRGGSLAKSAGLQIRARRGDELLNVEPQTMLRAEDQLIFDVRGERPCYLEVRLRDGTGAAETIFPAAGAATSARVSPGARLPVAHVVTGGGGKLVVTALFSDGPRPLGAPADPETLVTTAVVEKN